jgi:hypothetical protein
MVIRFSLLAALILFGGFSILAALMLFGSCDTDLRELRMSKESYTGDDLRIDGYYYSKRTSAKDIGIAVFYRDGVCIHTWGTPSDEDTLQYIENEILLNNAYISKIKKIPSHIGVFQITSPEMKFEIWEYRNTTFTHVGSIVNDTTFIINKRVHTRTGSTYSEKLTYRFKHFSPKPDSTNRFIK